VKGFQDTKEEVMFDSKPHFCGKPIFPSEPAELTYEDYWQKYKLVYSYSGDWELNNELVLDYTIRKMIFALFDQAG